jgi:hypothetical protein
LCPALSKAYCFDISIASAGIQGGYSVIEIVAAVQQGANIRRVYFFKLLIQKLLGFCVVFGKGCAFKRDQFVEFHVRRKIGLQFVPIGTLHGSVLIPKASDGVLSGERFVAASSEQQGGAYYEDKDDFFHNQDITLLTGKNIKISASDLRVFQDEINIFLLLLQSEKEFAE